MARIAVVDGNTGRYLVCAGPDVISESIFCKGDFEPVTRAIVIAACEAAGTHMTVVDVGANMGTFTIPVASALSGHAEVHAFEAQRMIYYQLCGNVFLNQLANVRVNNVAVGSPASQEETIEVPVLDLAQEQNLGGLSLDPTIRAAYPKLEHSSEHIPLVRLDDALGDLRIDVLKIDVEGMDLDVLRGASNLVSRDHPLIIVEALPETMYTIAGVPGRRSEISTWLLQRGYKITDLGTDFLAQHRDASIRLYLHQTGCNIKIRVEKSK